MKIKHAVVLLAIVLAASSVSLADTYYNFNFSGTFSGAAGWPGNGETFTVSGVFDTVNTGVTDTHYGGGSEIYQIVGIQNGFETLTPAPTVGNTNPAGITYAISLISPSAAGQPGFVPNGPNFWTTPDGQFWVDNALYVPATTQGSLDYWGLAYTYNTGPGGVGGDTYTNNLYGTLYGSGDPTTALLLSYDDTTHVGSSPQNAGPLSKPDTSNSDVTGFTATRVPEPGFYGVLVLGMSGLLPLVYRRRKA